jgi:hypothetical protein
MKLISKIDQSIYKLELKKKKNSEIVKFLRL